MQTRVQYFRGLAHPGLYTFFLVMLLAGCISAPSSDAFATSVVATVIAQQTAAVLPPPLGCESAALSEVLVPIREFNAPGLINIASVIRTPNSISLNPAGTCLVVSDLVGASIVDLANRQDVIRYLKYEDEPLMVRWSPDGALIAGSQKSRVVQLWDPNTGERKGAIRVEDQPDVISFIAWSPDSRYLLTLGGDQTAYIWNVSTRQVQSVIQADAGVHLISAAWSPNGQVLAFGTGEGELLFTEFPSGRLTPGRTESGNAVTSMAWSKDGKQLAYTEGNDIRIFDIGAGFPTQRLAGPQKQALALEWSPDDTMIAAGYAQSDFIVWQAAQGKILFENNEFAGDVIDVEWTQDGTLIITAGIGGIKYWGISK